MRAEGDSLRILAWPALTTPNIQPYIGQLYAPMKGRGVRVEELSQRRALFGRPQLVHAHWPDSLLHEADEKSVRRSLNRLGLLLRVLRLRGIKLLWTAHNLHSHEELHPGLEQRLWARWTRSLDGFISLSESGVTAVRERFPALANTPAFVVPHGHYRDAYPPAAARAEARRSLGLPEDARVLLFFGQVRAYKNVPGLIRAFRELPLENAVLLVAGQPDSAATEREVRDAASGHERTRLMLRFLGDEELPLLFGAADLTVLPFREILNSGSALLSLSQDCPVLVPAKGAMQELAESAGERWVSTFENELTPQVLSEALARLGEPVPGERPDLAGHDWERVVSLTIDAYHRLIHGTRP